MTELTDDQLEQLVGYAKSVGSHFVPAHRPGCGFEIRCDQMTCADSLTADLVAEFHSIAPELVDRLRLEVAELKQALIESNDELAELQHQTRYLRK